MRDLALALGYRSCLFVPLLREDSAIGCIAIAARRDRRASPTRRSRCAQTFADQAVIAIENVRLFNETQEALEQQTATAEVLQVISGSMADAQPVFDKILRELPAPVRRPTQLGVLLLGRRRAGARWRASAAIGARRQRAKPMSMPLRRTSIAGRAILRAPRRSTSPTRCR